MARLNNQSDNDDELPELSSLLKSQSQATITPLPNPEQDVGVIQSRRMETENLAANDTLVERHAITLEQAHVDPLLLPGFHPSVDSSESKDDQSIEAVDTVTSRKCPVKLADITADNSRFRQVSTNVGESSCDDHAYTDMSNVGVRDSATEGEALASRSPKKNKRRRRSRSLKRISVANFHKPDLQVFTKTRQASGTIDSILPNEKYNNEMIPESPPSNEYSRPGPVEVHTNLDDRHAL